jgi:hypothetical protein
MMATMVVVVLVVVVVVVVVVPGRVVTTTAASVPVLVEAVRSGGSSRYPRRCLLLWVSTGYRCPWKVSTK